MKKEVCKIGKDLYLSMIYRREGRGGEGGVSLYNLLGCRGRENIKVVGIAGEQYDGGAGGYG